MPGLQANQPPNQTSSQLGNISPIFQIYRLLSFLVQPFSTRLFTQVAPPWGLVVVVDGVETVDDTQGSVDWLTVRTVPQRRRCKGNVHRHDLRKIIGNQRLPSDGWIMVDIYMWLDFQKRGSSSASFCQIDFTKARADDLFINFITKLASKAKCLFRFVFHLSSVHHNNPLCFPSRFFSKT